MKKSLLVCCCLFLLLSLSQAQQKLSGRFIGADDGLPLVGVSLLLQHTSDSTQKFTTTTNTNGYFEFKTINKGIYRLRASYVGYKNTDQKIAMNLQDQNLADIQMQIASTKLKDVTVEAEQIRAEQKGDTVQYNASAFKVNRDASAEDLVTKMPGITNENGTVKAQGEQVQKVLVDGKEFFGDDASLALKNLPAEVIDKIQVFDRMSDQSRFTGFDDGNSKKTINIQTKRGRNEGMFGKFYGGYGTNDRFNAGLNLNIFKGDRRISILGLSNNINQQNFSMEDIMGVMGSQGGGQRGGGMGGPGGRGFVGGNMPQGMGNYMMQSSGMGNFMVGQQNGISTTHAIGSNYTDNWGKKTKVTGSYFFNYTETDNVSSTRRNYFNSKDSGLVYTENNSSNTINQNHRINFRFEYSFDTSNVLTFTPRLSLQQYSASSQTLGKNVIGEITPTSNTSNTNSSGNTGYSFSNNILYQHKFIKPRRTISFNVGTDVNDKTGDSRVNSQSTYQRTGMTDTAIATKQNADIVNNSYTLSGNLSYTEPVGNFGQLQAEYRPSFTANTSNKETKNFETTTNEYSKFDTLFSNKYDNTYFVNRGGISYRFDNNIRTNFMLGVTYQQANLDGKQIFPVAFKTQKTFENVLPNAMYNFKFTSSSNVRIFYRTSTNAPSITQLQNVINNSNPVLLTTGNTDLRQDYSHMLVARFGKTSADKGSSFFAFVYSSLTQDYIGNQTIIATKDTTINNYILRRGAQLTRPVNLDGFQSLRSFLTYGFPVKFIKSNLNLNAGFNYSRTPGLINTQTNYANNYTLNGGWVLSSNISERLDFTLAYNGNYNIVKNTLQTTSNNNYYYQTSSIKFNWIFLQGFVFNTNTTHTLYTGLNQGFNLSYLLCNASIGYKFLKNQNAEIKLNVFDLLNQNNSVNRTVTETYVEDNNSLILKQYFMLTFTYSIRKFKMN